LKADALVLVGAFIIFLYDKGPLFMLPSKEPSMEEFLVLLIKNGYGDFVLFTIDILGVGPGDFTFNKLFN